MRNTTVICDCTLPDGSVETMRIKLSPLEKVLQRIQETRELVALPTAADYGDVHMQQSIVYYAREALPDNVVDCAQILLPERTLQREKCLAMPAPPSNYTWAIIVSVYGIIGAVFLFRYA